MNAEEQGPASSVEPGGPRYALVVRLSREIESRIEDTYLGLPGITRPTMGYHITLLGPLVLAPGVPVAALEPVSAVCARWSPFEVQLGGLGAFDNEGINTIYLGVVDCDALWGLHTDLLEALEDRIEFTSEQYRYWNTTGYEPHVTLSLGLTERALHDLLEMNQRRRLRLEFWVEAVWLVVEDRAGAWQFVVEHHLGQG
ncbi:MAG: 2'-5' RNA ligase family protein [Chloroflexi bacterium]|nr:2'-5' RNA ligase family protein [Chloroflexota bacterium]